MSTTTVQSNPAVSSTLYVAREETRFGKLVKWFRYDSDVNVNRGTVEKVIKAAIGILLTLLLLPVAIGFFIIIEVRDQMNEENNLKKIQEVICKTPVVQKEDELSKEFQEQAIYEFTDDTLAKMFGKTQEEIAANRPTQAEIGQQLKKQPQYLKLLPKITVRDETTANKASQAFSTTELENAYKQASQVNDEKLFRLQEEYTESVDRLDQLNKLIENNTQATNTNAWRKKASSWTFGWIPEKDEETLQLQNAFTAMKAALSKEVEMRRQQLQGIQDNPSEVGQRIHNAEEQLAQANITLDQEKAKAKEAIEKIQASYAKTVEIGKAELQKRGLKIEEAYKKINQLEEQLENTQVTLNKTATEAAKDKRELTTLREVLRTTDPKNLAGKIQEQKQTINTLNQTLKERETLIVQLQRQSLPTTKKKSVRT